MTTNQEGNSPTGQEVLALLERVDRLIESKQSKGVYEEFRLFMLKAREYKFAQRKRKKGADRTDDDADADARAEDGHLQAALEAYPQALASVERGEVAARAAAQVPDAQSAVSDEAGPTHDPPPSGESVAQDAATPNAKPPGEVRFVRVDEVVVSRERMRQLGDISSLVDSIREIDLIEPIILKRETKELVSGLHRLESVRALGREEILARLIDVSDAQAEMIEIDENLMRIELSVLERAEHFHRRKQLYEALHPEVKHGGAPGKAGGGKEKAKEARAASFAADTAKKTGFSQRTVQEDVQVAKLSQDVKRLVKGTPLANKKRELLELSRLPPTKQVNAARAVTSGKFATVAEATQKSSGKQKARVKASRMPNRGELGPQRHARVAVVTALRRTAPELCLSCGAPSASSFTIEDLLTVDASGKGADDAHGSEEIKIVNRVIAGARAWMATLGKLPPEMTEERSRLLQDVVDAIAKGIHTLDEILDNVREGARSAA